MKNVLKVTTVYEIPCDEKDLDAMANAAVIVKGIDAFIKEKAGKDAVIDTAWRMERKREEPPAPSTKGEPGKPEGGAA